MQEKKDTVLLWEGSNEKLFADRKGEERVSMARKTAKGWRGKWGGKENGFLKRGGREGPELHIEMPGKKEKKKKKKNVCLGREGSTRKRPSAKKKKGRIR